MEGYICVYICAYMHIYIYTHTYGVRKNEWKERKRLRDYGTFFIIVYNDFSWTTETDEFL